MALIEVEFLKPAFEGIVRLVLSTGRAVPVPTLQPVGDDRLILTFRWSAINPSIQSAFPGFVPPPGTLLLRSSVVLTHASVAEINAQPNTPGTPLTGNAWLLATATRDQVVLTLVGFDVGAGPVPLAVPHPLGALPLPAPDGAEVVAAVLVADDATATLRLATSALDNFQQPPANRLLTAPGVSANWLVHVPAEFFVGMVLDPLIAGVSPPPDGAVLEEGPQASWTQLASGAWGVDASVGLQMVDACPGVFGDVDLSFNITVSAQFVENSAEERIETGLTIGADASDWDSFRCWLGSAGIGSLALGFINPYAGITAAIASLVLVSELLRDQVGAAAGSVPVRDFTEVSRTTSSISYSGSVPVEPLPFSSDVTFGLGADGLDIRGTILPIAPDHATSFNPDRGPLVGAWASRVNCSQRSMDHAFAFQDVLVADTLTLLGESVRDVPVTVYLTSVAEPAGKCWIKMPYAGRKVLVGIKAPGLRAGDTGFVVLHTSAGLRAYTLAPLPSPPSTLPDAQRLIDKFCDTLRVPTRAIDIQELKWVEPPPGYSWGHDPLRQWQIIVQGLPEDRDIEIRANVGGGPLLASRGDFASSEGRAAIEIVTDAETQLVLHTPNAGDEATVTVTTRWLLPQHRGVFDAPVRAFSRTASALTVHTDSGERSFDLDRWQSGGTRSAPASSERVIDREGQGLSLRPNRVVFIHQGDLVIATPVNTLMPEDL